MRIESIQWHLSLKRKLVETTFRKSQIFVVFIALVSSFGWTEGASLPGRYYQLLEAGSARVSALLNSEPDADLKTLEARSGWRHFPYAILAPAVLYAKQHPENSSFGDADQLALAIRIGDLLAREDERGTFEPRLDSDWDTYMWLEAYRLLQSELGEERRNRWKKALERNVSLVWRDASERVDSPWYNSPYIGTSPNHYAQYAGNLLLAGTLFENEEWKQLASQILQRFATLEQTEDGYWGEHSRRGPTTGYNYLTLSSVALYWELTGDPAALEALRRSTDFHKYFTYPDGTPVEVINDRNRHWGVSAWAHFAFSNFPDGRGYAEFLVEFFKPETLTMDHLGRLAQDALYYREGPVTPAPQLAQNYSHRMSVPAGIRKTGPWVVCQSGIVDTQAINSRFYLDRQGHLSIFHEEKGLIVTGANSKRQPELATFTEKLQGKLVHLPLSSRLEMKPSLDRLSLAYNTFWIDLLVPEPGQDRMEFRFVINGRGRPAEDPRLNLQLKLKEGKILETGSGRKIRLGADRIELGPQDLGGSIEHNGWRMELDPSAELSWPIYPHNPYADQPESTLEHAVGRLSVPLQLQPQPGRYIRPAEQEIRFRISAAGR